MDRTLILVKPDAFARGLSGEIIARFERKGLKIIAAKHMTVSEDQPRGRTGHRRQACEAWNSSGKNSPASRAADSGESDPWTMF